MGNIRRRNIRRRNRRTRNLENKIRRSIWLG